MLHTVASMHERKTKMSSLADGFLALPGGYGTLEEFCEVLTWKQLGLHQKPCGLLNVAQYYDPLLAMLDKAVDAGLMRPRMRSLVLRDLQENKIPIFEREGWLCQPSLSKIGILLIRRFLSSWISL